MASVAVIFCIFAAILHEGVYCKPWGPFGQFGPFGDRSWAQSGISNDGTGYVNVFNNGPTTSKPAVHSVFPPPAHPWSGPPSGMHSVFSSPGHPWFDPVIGDQRLFHSAGNTWHNPVQVNEGVYHGNGIGSVVMGSGNNHIINNHNNNQGSIITDNEDDYEVEDDTEWGEEEDDSEWGEEEDEGEWEEEGEEWEDEGDEGEWGEEEKSHTYADPIKPTKKPGNKPTETSTPREDYEAINKQKVAIFSSNVVGYQKQGNPKTIEGNSYRFTVQKYVKPGTEECFKMVTVRKDNEVKDNVKISCEYEEPDKKRGLNLRIGGVIYESLPFSVIYIIKDGVCLNKNYFEYAPIKQHILPEQECTELTGRTKKERVSGVIPGTEPIAAEDLAVMRKQIVAVLKGSVKGFKPQTQTTYTTTSFKVEVQDYVKGGQCVKVVSLKKDDHDQYFEQVKLPCEVTAPVVTDDEDMELNFGNLIYIQNGVSVVYVIRDGVCLERTYYVSMDQVKYNQRYLSTPECYTLTRWRQDQRSSSEKLNKQPPPKTPEAPGLMWILSLNGNTETGFTGNAGTSQFKGNALGLDFQEFVKQERCVRKVTLKIHGMEADKFLVSCGPIKNLNMIGDHVQYGKAFMIVPGPSANTYVARFNLRERSCVKKTYKVQKGSTVKILRSQNARTNDKECKGLMQGTLQANAMGWNNGGGSSFTINDGSISNFGNTYVMDDGTSISNVGSGNHVIM